MLPPHPDPTSASIPLALDKIPSLAATASRVLKRKVRKSELTPEFHSDLMKWCIASTVVLFTADSAILKIAVLPLKSLGTKTEVTEVKVATKTEVTEVKVATKTEVTFPVLFPRITGLNQNTQLSGFLHPSPPTPRRRVQTLICIVPCLSFSLV